MHDMIDCFDGQAPRSGWPSWCLAREVDVVTSLHDEKRFPNVDVDGLLDCMFKPLEFIIPLSRLITASWTIHGKVSGHLQHMLLSL